MFSPLDLIVENLRGLAIRVETLEARPMIAVAVAATAPVKSASSAVDEDKKITLSNANTVNANAVKSPSMAEFESKIQKLSGDIQAAKKLIETVMTIKIESHIARIEERILAKIDTRINLAIEKVNAAKPVAVAPVVPVTVPVAAAAAVAVAVVVDVVAPIVNVTALANAADDINITIGSHISVDDVVKSESGEFEIELKPKKDKSKKAK